MNVRGLNWWLPKLGFGLNVTCWVLGLDHFSGLHKTFGSPFVDPFIQEVRYVTPQSPQRLDILGRIRFLK